MLNKLLQANYTITLGSDQLELNGISKKIKISFPSTYTQISYTVVPLNTKDRQKVDWFDSTADKGSCGSTVICLIYQDSQ